MYMQLHSAHACVYVTDIILGFGNIRDAMQPLTGQWQKTE